MQKNISLRHCGFSLVELSVVIVIISLLVGGLAGLRSYTKNAALTTMMNESKFYTDAFSQFQTRYNAPPGDYASATAAWTGTNNGDGNGKIRAATVAVPSERWYAWQHLALSGFIPGKYSGAANSNGGATIGKGDASNIGNVPGSAMQGVAFLFDHPDEVDGVVRNASVVNNLYFDGIYSNLMRVAALDRDNSANIPNTGFLTPKQALQIDEKYDDGRPGVGNVTVPKLATITGCADSNDESVAVYNVTATYADQKNCYLFLKMQ